MTRFSPLQRNGVGDGGDGGHLQKTGQSLFAGAGRVAPLQQRLRQLHRNGRAAEKFFRISAGGLVGIENGQRVGHGIAGLQQMMVGDDQVQAQAARGFGLGKGSHAGVHRNDQPDALGVSRFKHARLQAVALAQPVRHMEAGHAAEHLDGRLEQHDGGGAVHVVVAVEQHRLARGDGPLQPGDGRVHAQHQQGIVEVSDFRIEEGEGFGGLGNAAGHQQLGQHHAAGGLPWPARRPRPDAARQSSSAGGGASGRCSAGAAARSSRWLQRPPSSPGLLVLVVVVVLVIVDDDVLEGLDVFQQRLEALIPLGGGLVQEDQALVDKAQLDVAEVAGVLAQPLRLHQFRGLFVGEVHLPGFFDQRVQFLALQRHLAEGHEGSADVLGHLHKVFPCVGVALALPHNGGNVLGDVAGQAFEAVALDKGHHVVFQRRGGCPCS